MSEIKTWEQRVEEDARDVSFLVKEVQHQDAEITELRARVAELEKDSMRLDYIESAWFHRNDDGEISFFFSDEWDAGKHESLRDAIDASR